MEDKILNIVITDKEMAIILPDGQRVPTKAKVKETFWESGKKDCEIIMEKPLLLDSQSKEI